MKRNSRFWSLSVAVKSLSCTRLSSIPASVSTAFRRSSRERKSFSERGARGLRAESSIAMEIGARDCLAAMLHSFVPDRGELLFPASLFPCKYEGSAGETDRARVGRGRYPLSISLLSCFIPRRTELAIHANRYGYSLRSFRNYNPGRQLWASDGPVPFGAVIVARRFLARLSSTSEINEGCRAAATEHRDDRELRSNGANRR